MARSFQARFLAIVRANEERMTRLFADLADAVIADVNRRADADGMVPRSALPELQATVGNRVTSLFLGRTRGGERAPFEVLPNGEVWPLSPYMRALWGSIRDVVRVPVEQHAGLMAARLPRDVAVVMRQATDDPLTAGQGAVREFFRPNPLAKYQPPHTWVDPNGYTLSDRVWNVAGDTRRRLDLYLDRAIAEGRGARAMAGELEQFLVPGRSLIRTKAPYGTDASYDAMRLARTEISRAHASAQEAAAHMNPFVEGLRVALSRRHPKRDVCDDAAEAGPWKVNEIPEQYRLPLHPHCLCSYRFEMIDAAKRDAILDALRADVRKERAALVSLVGPLLVDDFTNTLLNGKLTTNRTVPAPVVPTQPTAPQPAAPTPRPLVRPAPRPAPAVMNSPELAGDEIVFARGDAKPNLVLNGVKLESAPARDWASISDVPLNEPLMQAGSKRVSSGIVMVEDDGRIWLVEPKDHFGGYQHTFPKGGVARGLTMQQSALKEVWEESGLQAEITGFLTDAAGDTSVTRYYVGRRIGGAPWDAGWESWNVKLVTPERAEQLLNVQRDKNTLAALRSYLNPAPTTPAQVVAPAPVVAPPPVPTPTPVGGFPATLDELEHVKDLGGSTGARLVRDRATGKLYVQKRGNDAGHLLEETYADAAYRALGINVPEFAVYQTAQGPVKLAEFVEGRMLSELRSSDKRAYAAALKKLRKDFAADALLGNWDVVGMGYDNILVDASGAVWRIDNGGSLRRRAQGALKQGWDQYIDEFWTLRNPRINKQTADAFGDMGYFEVVKQMRALGKREDALIAALPDELKQVMRQRFEVMRDLVKMSDTLRKDSWVEGYVDDFARHSIGLRKDGMIDRLPKRLTVRGTYVTDETGKPWDNLRGSTKDTMIGDVSRYMGRNGGNWDIITYWSQRQASDSWTGAAQATKYFYAKQRGVDLDATFWWKHGLSTAEGHYQTTVAKLGESVYRETMTAWHAFNYEFLRNVEFRNNKVARGLVRLIRTEARDVMAVNNLARGQRGLMRRGAVESTSVFEQVSVFGSEVTIQDVPHHRIFGNYMLERSPGYNGPMFLSDRENEMVAMMDGIEVHYVR